MLVWMGLAATAQACDGTTFWNLVIDDLRAERREAWREVHATDWDTRLATEDRDRVLAEQASAVAEWQEARRAVKRAKLDRKDAIASCVDPDHPPTS